MSRSLRVHHLQHVPFEGLGSMGPYLDSRGHSLSSTHLYLGQDLPPVRDLDWVIVMGGPMGVHDEEQYGWLRQEKAFIRKAIDAGKTVLGVCLGAQLMADALGAAVRRNGFREIGWFPVQTDEGMELTVLGDVIPPCLDAFHWHGDTFDIPDGAVRLGSSEACRNQGFILDDRILALQFHLETTPDSARALVENCGHELDGSLYVQTSAEMLADPQRFGRINAVMRTLLERLEERTAVDR